MRKTIAVLYATVLIYNALPAAAQNKQITIEQAVTGRYTQFAPKSLGNISWMPGSNTFIKVADNNGNKALMLVNAVTLKEDTLTTIDAFNNEVFGRKALTAFPKLEWLDKNTAWFAIQNYYFKLRNNGSKWTSERWLTLQDAAENAEVDRNTGNIVYTKGNNLYLLNNGKEIQITDDRDTGIVNGQSVHRQEFGIDKGIFISPKGNYIAFYRMDQSMVEKYPITNWTTLPATTHYTRYPFAGRKSHHVTLGVYNIKSGKTVYMKTGMPADQYLTCVTWAPGENAIFIALLNRDQNHLKLNEYNVEDGTMVHTVLQEQDAKYVHPENPLYFIPGKNDEFLWFSDRSGYRHIYRYNIRGKLLSTVTKGNFDVTTINGFNTAQNKVYITAANENGMDRYVYSAAITGGKMQKLSYAAGTHKAEAQENGRYLIDIYSGDAVPPTTVLADANTGKSRVLLANTNLYTGYELANVKSVTLKAEDGTPLNGKLITPKNMNPAKKYPTIVYLYNGPNVQLLANSYPASQNLWYDYMAAKGYVIFCMDGRGSKNRGMKFEQATFRRLGTIEMQDQMVGINYLKSLPFIDASRMGIHGWSFGGFMTLSFMLNQPDIFKCAVAGGPVTDWKMYEVMYTERYMDTPQKNPEGYAEANLLDKADRLKGKLLIIHGAQDSTVVWQQSMDFLNSAVKAGKQVDYFVYPNHEHNVMGYDRIHLMQKISDYFDLYLKPGE